MHNQFTLIAPDCDSRTQHNATDQQSASISRIRQIAF